MIKITGLSGFRTHDLTVINKKGPAIASLSFVYII